MATFSSVLVFLVMGSHISIQLLMLFQYLGWSCVCISRVVICHQASCPLFGYFSSASLISHAYCSDQLVLTIGLYFSYLSIKAKCMRDSGKTGITCADDYVSSFDGFGFRMARVVHVTMDVRDVASFSAALEAGGVL
ncbi:hypothetical protein SADUNF_Sadunf08G0005400 [Salix dunnii]|uniref:Uncharacterized protein n=1 Tax=Salix dunnii TaxID=1413687 RepID=A0A835JXI6_9ROSI|nr:hypothetical protein SADUNF_Sadunf08G0005400 [Salix dunnii]